MNWIYVELSVIVFTRGYGMRILPCFVLLLLSMVGFSRGGNDTLDSSSYLKDGDTLVSAEGSFTLGFFSAGNSKSRFLGIWYSTAPDAVVWVANRENALNDSCGLLEFGYYGNIVLLNCSRTIIWSSNMSGTLIYPTLQMLDSGNLVLTESSSLGSGDYSWQSFDYPSDTILAGLRVGWDLRTGFERSLTSWKSTDDPAPGHYTYGYDREGLPQAVINKGSVRKYRSGPWNGVQFTGISMPSGVVSTLWFVYNTTDIYFEFQSASEEFISKVTLNSSGSMHCLFLNKGSSVWDVRHTIPSDPCDHYEQCGANGFCRPKKDLICECLPGFVPKLQEEWETLNHDSGCVREIPLNCSNEGFQKVSGTNLPDLKNFWLDKNMSLRDCRDKCYKDCSCKAYAISDVRNGGNGCLMWFGDLVDVKELPEGNHNVQDIFIRLSDSSLGSVHDSTQKKKLVIASVASTITGLLILVLTAWTVTWKVRSRRRGLKTGEYGMDLPSFSFAAIAAATDNFSNVNLIGEGGFGSVYKGRLSTDREVAVKRLSKNSGQGLEEFTNEVVLIARLQHKNLVGLVGCCIEKTERMLIYEYMPNKSLDYFIFDRDGSCSLTWERRYSIVCGIARGLVYLHHDSKLQVIHRDLKASNILLDGDLNPKISDFGLARIFTGNDKAKTTRRIIGSHGYMSPEYAYEGEFSTKSDVYSFGVLLLEIVTGRRNVGFRHPDHQHNLLGHVWLFWLAGRVLQLVDELGMELPEPQAERCIHVGLLCVQKLPADRPSMASVAVMLANDGAELPQPKQPGFFLEQTVSGAKECYPHTDAVATMTLPHGR